MTTLEEAIATGRGTERPFRCHEHDDNSASASVNVVKNVWYCYACHAKGVVDGSRVPTLSELEAMLEPEVAGRTYPSSWLDTFGYGGYWLDRFPDWLCWFSGLGEDPWTGDATFPVHTPRGRLSGVGRRLAVPGSGPRYKYPPSWSASRTLFGSRGQWKRPETGVLMLVEGAADATAGWEVGIPTFACYGAGLHAPQIELITRMQPKLVVTGFDMDDAGARATDMTERALRGVCEIAPVQWPVKDPADTPVDSRLQPILDAVAGSLYGDLEGEVIAHTRHVIKTLKDAYVEEAR